MQIDQEVVLSGRPDFLRYFYRTAIIQRLAIAIWRSPGQRSPQALVDLSGRCQLRPICLQPERSGFVISPFINFGGERGYFLSPHIFWRAGRLRYANDEIVLSRGRADFDSCLQELLHSANGKSADLGWHVPPSPKNNAAVNKETYLKMIADAVAGIKQSHFKKVVLSRTLERPLPTSFDVVDLFDRLCEGFPGAFVSLVALPEIGTWVGATPELHLTMGADRLRTVALAGTMPASRIDVVWGAKELDEQAIVSEYIRACFQRHNLNNVDERGPETVRVGDLLHLQTTFSTNLGGQNFTALNRFLLDLHPTPAVCGLPKEAALRYIQKTEPHDREFYSGFLGPVGFDGGSHLFVNLRCLQLLSASAVLYAGVGVTKDSDPEKEWLETQLKFNALLKFLDVSEEGRDVALFSPAEAMSEEMPRR